MQISHRLATAIVATFFAAATLPVWAAPRFLEGAVSFSGMRMTTTAIDPDGPTPGLIQTIGPFGHLVNELCFKPAYCERVYVYDASYRPGSTPMPLHAELAFFGSSVSGDVAPGMTSIATHIEFTEGVRQNSGLASAEFMVPMFDVLPNTVASFSARLHGRLSAIDPEFPYRGMLFAWSSLSGGEVEPQIAELTLFPSPVAQTFDQLVTLSVRNDTETSQRAWWTMRSGFELSLPVPEPASWLMLLAGLAVLAGVQPVRGGASWSQVRRQLPSWRPPAS